MTGELVVPKPYRAYTLEWRKSSGYADIYCLANGTSRVVAKRIKRNNGDSGFLGMCTVTEKFRTTLADVGVPVPELYEFHQVSNGESPDVWHIVSYAGEDLLAQLINHPHRAQEMVTHVLAAIEGVLSQTNRTLGLDPRLSNFGDTYFDLFPPLIVLSGMPYVHYPNPTDPKLIERELERKFTPEGIVRRLRFELMVHNPQWDRLISATVSRIYCEPLRSRLTDYLSQLPDNRVDPETKDRSQIGELIHRCIAVDDIDSLREIAAKIIPVSNGRHVTMNDVFHLTSHFHSSSNYPASRAQRLEMFLTMMETYLSSKG
ncbi:MAG: hypothetical protein WAP74_03465 [Patescibacteria group bacterium]